jgi:hypothetical protein
MSRIPDLYFDLMKPITENLDLLSGKAQYLCLQCDTARFYSFQEFVYYFLLLYNNVPDVIYYLGQREAKN